MATLIDSDNHCDNITVTSITIPLIVDFDNIRISAKIADANLLKTKNIKQETKKKKNKQLCTILHFEHETKNKLK